MLRKQKGITLVALVITIIVLLILAGVTISMVVGNNGILSRARQSNYENMKAEAIEKVERALASTNMLMKVNATDDDSTNDTLTDSILKSEFSHSESITAGDDWEWGTYDSTNNTITLTYKSQKFKNASSTKNGTLVFTIEIDGDEAGLKTPAANSSNPVADGDYED